MGKPKIEWNKVVTGEGEQRRSVSYHLTQPQLETTKGGLFTLRGRGLLEGRRMPGRPNKIKLSC